VLTVVIQAGGESSRMGEDKALKPFLGRPLIERVIERLSPIADDVIVTTNRPNEYAFLKYRLISDLQPGRGALGGLYTAIASASTPFVAVVACDMPFASPKLIEAAHKRMVQESADLVIARVAPRAKRAGKTDECYEPFHAVYRRETCLPAIGSALKADQWKVSSWFPMVKVRELTAEEVKWLDPSGLCFWNLNTPEEFAKAEQIAEGDSHL
jgi:molybdopterin-guanine dinucleotide biosynthesis protein A